MTKLSENPPDVAHCFRILCRHYVLITESCCVDDDEANTKAEKLVNQILNEGKDVPVDDTPMLLPPYYDHTLVTK